MFNVKTKLFSKLHIQYRGVGVHSLLQLFVERKNNNKEGVWHRDTSAVPVQFVPQFYFQSDPNTNTASVLLLLTSS